MKNLLKFLSCPNFAKIIQDLEIRTDQSKLYTFMNLFPRFSYKLDLRRGSGGGEGGEAQPLDKMKLPNTF